MMTRRAVLASLIAGTVRPGAAADTTEHVEVFRAGEAGFHTFRIPALLVTRRGALLAFAEGRRESASDSGEICVVMKRSSDDGRTWSAPRVVAQRAGYTIGNPCPVQDRSGGTGRGGRIFLPLTGNPANVSEAQIIRRQVEARRTVFMTYSDDDGLTWTGLREITESVRRPNWTWYATGPGVGIQTRRGRLMIPCDHNVEGQEGSRSHVFFSDDHGATWQLGGGTDGVTTRVTNECQIAELRDGSLVLNMRGGNGGVKHRGITRSTDGGMTWSPVETDEGLPEPVCQASLIAHKGLLYFSNPAALKRERMTVRVSGDGGKTWRVGKVLYEGPAAYSCLAVLRGGRLGCLYERGVRSPYEGIVMARFRPDRA